MLKRAAEHNTIVGRTPSRCVELASKATDVIVVSWRNGVKQVKVPPESASNKVLGHFCRLQHPTCTEQVLKPRKLQYLYLAWVSAFKSLELAAD